MQKCETEHWKTIDGWVGLYEASSLGRIRSLDRTVKGRYGPTRYKGRILKPGYGAGYALVTLVETGQGRRQQSYVHDLVLQTFVGPKLVGLEACHGPAGERNNAISNLRYDTRQANSLDRHLFGIGWKKKGRKPPTSVQCSVCKTTMLVYRRREAAHHLCAQLTCRRQSWTLGK